MHFMGPAGAADFGDLLFVCWGLPQLFLTLSYHLLFSQKVWRHFPTSIIMVCSTD